MNVSKTGPDIVIRQENPDDHECVEELGELAFGPGRFSRAAFRLREGVKSEPELSFVATIDGKIIGSVKQTGITIGGKPALVLGPLMVAPALRSFGVGRELMNRTLLAARQAGHGLIVLVGDLAYYEAFGFKRVRPGKITFPGPVDPSRILVCELEKGIAVAYEGQAKKR